MVTDQHDAILTRSHEDTKAHPSYRTGQNPSSVSPCIRVKPASVGSVLKDPHGAIAHTETRRHGGFSIAQHSTAQNSTKPKLRDSVSPCETLLLLAQCSRAEALRR